MPKPLMVVCPACGTKQPMRLPGESIYRCPRCGGMFDDAPDEGGDYCTDPTRRLERREEERARRKQKR